jgi:hypothetical protein
MSVETQRASMEKFTRRVKQFCKELDRREPGGSNWHKTREKLERYIRRLKSSIQAYYGEGGHHCDLVGEADNAMDRGRQALESTKHLV